MRTYIVIATESERKIINDFNHMLPSKISGVIVTGVGGLNVIEKLKKLKKNSRIINIGYVGSNHWEVGTLLIVKRTSLYHPNVRYESPIYELNTRGLDDNVTCFTSNDFVLRTNIKSAVVFDMELAFICSLGFKEVLSFKKVSDKLDYKQYQKAASKE